MTHTIDGQDLGIVENISVSKSSNIIPVPIPGSDSDETETFDALGPTKIVTVSGKFVGSSLSAVQDLIGAIELVCDGNQESSVIFVSDELGSLDIKISDFEYSFDNNVVTRAFYTLRLIQGV